MHILFIWHRVFSYIMTLIAVIGVAAFQQVDIACAQADLNIQSRIDAVAAPFQVQPIPILPGTQTRPAPQKVVEVEPACVAKGRRCLSSPEIDAVFAAHAKGPNLFSLTPGGSDALTELKSEATPLDRKRNIIKTLALPINIKPSKKVLALPVGPPNLKPGPGDAPTQPTSISFTFPSSPIYESNANKSNRLGRSDSSVSFGGGFTITTQGFRNLDVIGISAGGSLVRYARLADRSFDTLTGSAQYQMFLGAYDISAKMIDLTHGSNLPTGQVTFNTLTFGLQNSTAFAPTFRAETTSLTTPTVVYSWQNIPFNRELCATKLNQQTSSFCYFADLSATVGHTLSDNRLLENTNLSAAATLGHRIGGTDLVALWGTTITGRTYENVIGGRNDFTVQFGPKLQYRPLSKLTTSIGVTYNRNYSSLATAEWHGWIVQSALTLSF